MAKNVTSEKIPLTNVRLSFPALDKPKAFKEGIEPKFEASFLLDPTNKDHAAAIAKISPSLTARPSTRTSIALDFF